MTDCRTFFQKDCWMFLLRHLLKNPDDCVGLTGHQRVMRWGDQNLDYLPLLKASIMKHPNRCSQSPLLR